MNARTEVRHEQTWHEQCSGRSYEAISHPQIEAMYMLKVFVSKMA